MNKLTLALATILTVNTSNANIISSLWESIKSTPDVSRQYDGLEKRYITNNLYVYKLSKKRQPTEQPTTVIPYDKVAIAKALEYQNSKHPDNKPIDDVITNNETSASDSIATKNEKHIVYGDESPLKDEAVLSAWDKAYAAEKRLEEHRRYMERVRKARKTIEQSKTVSASNQTSGS